jgi:hypothetical protein
VDADALRAFALRDRAPVARLKREYWAERYRAEGPGPGMRAARDLWEHMRALRPEWPTDAERAEDLRHHVALKECFARIARARSRG